MTPSRTRYWVVVFAVTLAVLSYVDRVCISQTAGQISADLHLTKEQMGAVFSSFALSYALFEIPGGFLGDWLGPRRVLTRIVISWSFFTAATGFANSFNTMRIVRFLFGAGEAGCFPNLTKSFSIWLPHSEKTRAQSILWMCARWGGAVTPKLVFWTLLFMTWRTAFMVYGLLGVVWAILFFRWFRDDPQTHPGVNAAERELLRGSASLGESHVHVPWGKMLGSRSIWLLWVQYFCLSYPWYFYITWLPTYLQEHRHLNANEASLLSGVPLLMGGFGSLLAGYILPRMSDRLRSVARSRRIVACTGFAGAAVLLTLSIKIESPYLAMLAMGMASFFNDFVMPAAWSSCMDVGGKAAGTISGSMNMMGNLAGFVAPWLGGSILTRTNNDWDLVLYIAAAVYIGGLLCWPLIDPVTPLTSSDPVVD